MRQLKGLSCLLSLFLCGCATSALELAPASPDRPWQPATDASGEIQPGTLPPADASVPKDYVLPSNTALAQLPPAPSGIDGQHAYTLPELIDIAQSNNPSTRIAWAEARNAALAAGIAKSAYLPDVSAIVVGGYQTGHHSNSALGLNASNS